MTSSRLAGVVLVSMALTPLVKADIVTSIGDTAPPFANGSHPTSAAALLAQVGSPSPFLGACGSDIILNCSASWTFNYTVPIGETVTSATLTLGIFDIDSAAKPGEQVASYLLGTTNMTAALNTVSDGLNGGTGATNNEYDVLTVNVPSTAFATLQSGSAPVSLALQGPGLGILGQTKFNGAALIFSTLDIQTATPVPEPAALPLLLTAVGAFGILRLRRKPN